MAHDELNTTPLQGLLMAGLLALGLALPGPASADGSERFGDYVVYFNAFSSDQLSPQMAKAYDIVRSGNRALVNISVQKVQKVGAAIPVDAEIRARVSNLTGQLKEMSLRRIEEGGAIYYLGQVDVANQEVLVFELEISPAGETRSYPVRFQQAFYVD